MLDLVLGVLEVLNMSNDYTSSLNISYDNLMGCSLYELQYWCEIAKDKIERAEELAEKNKG